MPVSRPLLERAGADLLQCSNAPECCQGHIIVGTVMDKADSGMASDRGAAGSAVLVSRPHLDEMKAKIIMVLRWTSPFHKG